MIKLTREASQQLADKKAQRGASADRIVVGGLGIIALFGAVTVVGLQLFAYLKAGEWVSLSIVDALAFAGSKWAVSPHDWIGLHKLLFKVPLSASLAALGLMFYAARN